MERNSADIPNEVISYIEKHNQPNRNCQYEVLNIYYKARIDELLPIEDFGKYIKLYNKRNKKGYIETYKIKALLKCYYEDDRLVKSGIVSKVYNCFCNNSKLITNMKIIKNNLIILFSNKNLTLYQKMVAIFFVVVLSSQMSITREDFRDFLSFYDDVKLPKTSIEFFRAISWYLFEIIRGTNYHMAYMSIYDYFNEKENINFDNATSLMSLALDYDDDEELTNNDVIKYIKNDSLKFSPLLIAIYYLKHFICFESSENTVKNINEKIQESTKEIDYNLDTICYMLFSIYDGSYSKDRDNFIVNKNVNANYKKFIVWAIFDKNY